METLCTVVHFYSVNKVLCFSFATSYMQGFLLNKGLQLLWAAFPQMWTLEYTLVKEQQNDRFFQRCQDK